MVKDKTGFIWIGTDNGLYRFDGQNFKAFLHQPADPHSLSTNNLSGVFIEKDGSFWINHKVNGASRFDPVSQQFTIWENRNKSDIDISKVHVAGFFEDSQERLWFLIEEHGLALLNKKDQSLKLFSFLDTSSRRGQYTRDHLNNIVEDKQGHLWISSNDGFIQFDPATGKFDVYKPRTTITYVFIDSAETIWLATWGGGLKKFDRSTREWTSYKYFPGPDIGTKNIIFNISNKDKDELWVATGDNWLQSFNKSTGKFKKVASTNATNNKSVAASNLYHDHSDMIWCSGGKSLTRIDSRNNYFKFIPIPDNPLYGSGYLMANSFLKRPDDSLLYIGVYYSKGFYTLNQQTGEYKSYPLIPRHDVTENINQIFNDNDNNIWTCFGNGAFIFDPGSKKFSLPTGVKNAELLRSSIFAALKDRDGKLWFASRENGLLVYDKSTAEIRTFLPAKNRFVKDYIYSLYLDSKENLWLGFHGKSGIAVIRKSDQELIFYDNEKFKIPATDITAITESKEGDIFFTLDQQGLGVIKNPLSDKESFVLYTNYNGLSGNRVTSLVKDKQDYIWVTTNNGISRCRSSDMSFQHFSQADGLRQNLYECNLYCDDNGIIYAGVGDGFQYFDPAAITASRDFPPVILHSFKIKGNEYGSDINSSKGISLKHKDASFSFEFAVLAFNRNEQFSFEYRLKGLENEWQPAGKNRIAAYSLAHGGDYELQVRATNGFGEWNENIYRLPISIRSPFWETWWFIAAAIAFFILIVVFITRNIIRRNRAVEIRKAHLHQVRADAEMKALRAQMNPHFIFNCMNTIDAYIFKNKTEAASAFLNKFSKLIRLVLENSRHAFISIEKDVEALKLYIELEEQRNDFSFTHTITIPDSLKRGGLKIPPLLIQPFVENAILHGLRHRPNGNGLLSVSFFDEPGEVVCRIEDNGIGRKASELLYAGREKGHQSLGTAFSGDRISLLNELDKNAYSLMITDITDENATGTVVKLILPKISE